MPSSGDDRSETEEEVVTMTKLSAACPACPKVIESPTSDAFTMMMEAHLKVCEMMPKQTDHSASSQQKSKLVNKRALDKMEVKEKAHGMQPADWIRFEDMWSLWRVDQAPELNLSIHLLNLFPNAKKEITSKLSKPYMEKDIIKAAKEVLIVQINTGIGSSLFHRLAQMYNESIEAFISRIKDAAIPCNFRQQCKCGEFVDYTDRMVRDRLLVGMHDENTKIKAIEQWNSKDASGMSLRELSELCTTIEEGKALKGKMDNTGVNAVSTYKANKRQPTNDQPKKQQCRRCGESHQRRYCDSKNLYCNFCNVNSHNTVVCFKKKRAEQGKNGTDEPTPSAVSTNAMQSRRDWLFHVSSGSKQPMVRVLGQPCSDLNSSIFEVDALADTGAEQCIMDKACFRAIPGCKVKLDQSNTFILCAKQKL